MPTFSPYMPVPEEVVAPANGSPKPKEGEETGRQDYYQTIDRVYGQAIETWGYGCPNGNNRSNPCGFPGYGSLYMGRPSTYRFMLDHPRIRQVRAQVWNTILSGEWSWEVREGTNEAWVELLKDMFDCQRLTTLIDTLRALDYGHAGFEKVWEVRDGKWWMVRSKPLAVDTTGIMIDKATGDFVGLRYGPTADWLNKSKCWLFTYDGEAGEYYGRSRLENIRSTAWRDWLDAATDMFRLSEKISGIIPIITTPSGSYTDSTGKTTSWSSNAIAAIKALRTGQGVWFPTAALPDQRTADNLALAKISLVNIDVKDFGSHAPAIAGLLERMQHDEDLMFAGYLRSARTGMQSKNGSRADSEQHTDTDTTDCEIVDALIAEAFNKQVVDDVLTLNFGEQARGAVYIKPAKLRDIHREVDLKIIDAALNDPELRQQYLEQVAIDTINDRRGVPTLDGKDMVLEAVPTDTTGETLIDSGGGSEEEGSTQTED